MTFTQPILSLKHSYQAAIDESTHLTLNITRNDKRLWVGGASDLRQRMVADCGASEFNGQSSLIFRAQIGEVTATISLES